VSRLWRRTLFGVAFGLLLYAAASLWLGLSTLGSSLTAFHWSSLALALSLSCLNYAVRFGKWELCLRWLAIRRQGPGMAPRLSVRRSGLIYLAGLSMSVTPAKLGEVLRSVLLQASDGVPTARTAPIVIVDRLTDVVALALLCLAGVSGRREYWPAVGTAAGLVLVGVLVLGRPRLAGGLVRVLARLPGLGRALARAQPAVESSARLLAPGRLLALSGLSLLGWGLECVGYWAILHGFAGVDADLELCTFLWSATTLVGALSFLPGGLGATEGSLALLAARLVAGLSQATAVASTLLIRAATLWWGELVGATALLLLLRDPKLRARAHEDLADPAAR
jgi:uncharacterized membrane protein YbhN (UPF0104 family)